MSFVVHLLHAENLTQDDNMSYQAFEKGLVVAHGLPDGVQVQDINSYSATTCKYILDNESAIIFKSENIF